MPNRATPLLEHLPVFHSWNIEAARAFLELKVHLGRFALEYRRRFGERPSATRVR